VPLSPCGHGQFQLAARQGPSARGRVVWAREQMEGAGEGDVQVEAGPVEP